MILLVYSKFNLFRIGIGAVIVILALLLGRNEAHIRFKFAKNSLLGI